MNDPRIRKVVIVGGGTAGWMTAAPLAQLMRRHRGGPPCEVLLVESPDIGTIGVGEATLPSILQHNRALGLDPAHFLSRTQASFKLGIEFRDWGHLGHRFFHGFGDFGPPIEGRAPWQHWLRLQRGGDMPTYEDWSMASVMARSNRFTPPQGDRPSAANAYSYAFHFDASLYAAYLREVAMELGAQRIEGTIVEVERRAEDGFVAALRLADGRRIEGDLFVDCSGLRGLLIEGAMQAGFDDWSAMLPCNSALAVPCARVEPLTPYTVSAAQSAGWTWRIPLQHRTGNGHVYCSGYTSDEEAAQVLLQGLDGKALDTPRPIRFTTGRRRQSWVKNVVAIGLSAGFLEPLESTSIHLILDNVGRLIHFFPDRDFRPELIAEFNRLGQLQFEAIRDFIVLHYKLTQRSDSEFWRYCAAMPIPDTLAQQIELFHSSGRVRVLDPNGFQEPSWVSIYFGLGLLPERHDPFVDQVDEAALRTHFTRLRAAIAQTAAAMPQHGDYIQRAVL
jgi:Tryptophan halogenase